VVIPEVPRTLNGKKCEVAVKNILADTPARAGRQPRRAAQPRRPVGVADLCVDILERFRRLAHGRASDSPQRSLHPPAVPENFGDPGPAQVAPKSYRFGDVIPPR
jgi:hypothetical protein